jgi:hypothetical protein
LGIEYAITSAKFPDVSALVCFSALVMFFMGCIQTRPLLPLPP